MEAKLFTDDVAHVSTFAFHEHRERAPHLEQWAHRPRLEVAFRMVLNAAWHIHQVGRTQYRTLRVVDLGCGDGGLLSLLGGATNIDAVGYDFQPSNEEGWKERGVSAYACDFVSEWSRIPLADIYVMTECLEHLTDPHNAVRRVFERGASLVASSPWTEHAASHDECHAWAWDQEGYATMMRNAGFAITEHETTGMFQVVRCA